MQQGFAHHLGARIWRDGCMGVRIVRLRQSIGICGTALWLPAAGLAAGFDGALGWQSDKLVRGFSQSGGDPVASLDGRWLADSGWSLHGGLSSLGRDRRRGSAEFSAGAGCGGFWGRDWAWQGTATHYRSLGAGEQRRPPYEEIAIGLGWAGRLNVVLGVAPAYPGPLPGGGRGHGRLATLEATWQQPLGAGWALEAGLGRADYSRIAFADFGFGSLGLSLRLGRAQLVASRIFNNSPASSTGARAVLALAWSL
jgi:hypothetical protein